MSKKVIIAIAGTLLFTANPLALAEDSVKSLATSAASAKVSVMALEKLLTNPWEEAQARVISLNDVPLSAEISGIVNRMEAEVGDVVRQGQPLVIMNDWTYRFQTAQQDAGLEVLKGQLHLAQQQLERVRSLHTSKQTTRERLDVAQAEVTVLKARVQQQQELLEESRARQARTRIHAPFAGVVVERMAHIGSWITPGSPLLRLVDTQHVNLEASIASDTLERVKGASAWQFRHQNQTYTVRLKMIVPLEAPATGTREVRFDFTDQLPVPGAAGRLQWQDPRPHLPSWILVKREGTMGIFFERDNKAVFQPLKQATEGSRTPWPLADRSLRVIVDGRQSLKDGESLSITETVTAQP